MSAWRHQDTSCYLTTVSTKKRGLRQFAIQQGVLIWHSGTTLIKSDFIFYLRISRYSKLILFVSPCQNYLEPEHGTQRKIRNIVSKIIRRSRSPDNAEFGHFVLSFCRGLQRNVPRIITHVHSYCFGSVVVVVMGFLNSLITTWHDVSVFICSTVPPLWNSLKVRSPWSKCKKLTSCHWRDGASRKRILFIHLPEFYEL